MTGDFKVNGKVKDKAKGVLIVEFVGLKSKMYLFIKEDHKEDKKANRINKNVFKNITHKEYENILFEKKQMRHNTKRMQSKSHQLGTNKLVIEAINISSSCFDAKRYALDGGIKSFIIWL